MNKFRRGDLVVNTNESSRYFREIAGRPGTFEGYWSEKSGGELLTLRDACDVRYPGLAGPYGYPSLAQSADDLELFGEENEARCLQKVACLSVQELACRVGVSRQAYYKWLNGKTIAAKYKRCLKELIAVYENGK